MPLRRQLVAGKIRSTNEQIEQASFQPDAVTRKGDLAKASELQYGTLPQLEKQPLDESKKLAVLDGKGDGMILGAEESAWLQAYWEAAGT